jgi:two-component system sensor kinase FixL
MTATIPTGQESNGVLREVLAGLSGLHHMVLVTDDRGRVVWMSDGLQPLLGDPKRHLGRDWSELFPHLPRPEELEEWEPAHHAHRSRGNGAIDVSAFRVPGSEGGAPYCVAVVRPAQPERRAADDTAAILGAILDSSPDAVLAIDEAGFVTYANPAVETILGEPPASLLDKPLALLMKSFSVSDSALAELEAAAGPDSRELEILRRDGRRVWISVSARALRLPGGEARGAVAFVRDVTEPRQVQELLESKNAELENYVHSVSHDLRSPLVSLLGFTRLLRQDYEEVLDETGRHFVDRIEQAGRNMESLIHDLLELSQIGRPGELRTLVDPRAVLLQIQAELKLRLDEQGVALHLPTSPPLLYSDRTRLYQLFSNLIGNAVKHMGAPDDPAIHVDIRTQGEHHLVSVRDNGRGIPPHARERIFEVFQTLRPRAGSRRSTGIGLTIVKKIVDSHQGRVWVESEPGRGTIFHVLLPRR